MAVEGKGGGALTAPDLLASLRSGLHLPVTSAQTGVPGPQKDIKGPQYQIDESQVSTPVKL